MKTTVYTVVPHNRIGSIVKHGIVPNNKLSELNIDEEIKKVNFIESEMGYIYASTCIRNAIDWYKVINKQTNLQCFLLKYEIDSAILERDSCSPHDIKTDVRFKDKIINPENITIVKVNIYKDYYVDFSTKEEVLLQNAINPFSYLINDYYLKHNVKKESMKNLNENEKGIYYTVTVKEGLNILKNSIYFDYNIIAIVVGLKNFNKANCPTLFTTDLENAIAWKNVVDSLSDLGAIILKCSIDNKIMEDNITGVNSCFSNVRALTPIRVVDIIDIIY